LRVRGFDRDIIELLRRGESHIKATPDETRRIFGLKPR